MGNCAEEMQKNIFTREEQDEFSIESLGSPSVIKEGIFKNEIVPVTVKMRKGELLVDSDEGPGKANFDK